MERLVHGALVLMLAAVVATIAAPIAIASPRNDRFDYNENLEGQVPVELTVSNAEAGVEPEEPPLGRDGAGHTIWFFWMAPATNVPFVISTCESDFPSRVDIYEGELNHPISELSPASETEGVEHAGQECEYVVHPEPGEYLTSYYIRADGLDHDRATGEALSGEGNVKLRITAVRPPNDDFADARRLEFGPGRLGKLEATVTSADFGATMEPGEQTAAAEEKFPPREAVPGGASIWYTWSSPASWAPENWSPNVGILNLGRSMPVLYTGHSLADLKPVEVQWVSAGDWEYKLVPGETYWLQQYAPLDPETGTLRESEVYFSVTLRDPSEFESPYLLYHDPLLSTPSSPDQPAVSAPTAPPSPPSPPQTTIAAKIVKPKAGMASFRFASEPAARFRCRLDSAPWRACKSPTTYRNLSKGHHAFGVAAVSQAGMVDASPAVTRFAIADARAGRAVGPR